MAVDGVRLGAFVLGERLGMGGMGEVFRGLHEADGVPVAVKIVMGRLAQEPSYRESFRREVQAIAGLNHPGVITVLDQGEVDGRAQATSGGRLVAGSPYLVMELATGGALHGVKRPLRWRVFRKVFLSLLDALAHAHARGVLHRDIKPDNILICQRSDLRPGLKLTDFGIAHALDRVEGPGDPEGFICGTPEYMAPEQFTDQWRDFGPWTDLYALGCVAWEMVCGRRPFSADMASPNRPTILARQHLYDARPPLEAACPLPSGLEAWIHRMMAVDPADRFQRAADAAWALAALTLEGVDEQVPGWEVATSKVAMLSTDGLEDLTSSATLAFSEIARAAPPREAGGPPPLPPSWRRRRVEAPLRLAGAGLGLSGLREIPMVGREAERDRIWAALGQVQATGRARLVVLRGPAGVGKSRLARWMAQRADEVGNAAVWRVSHSEEGGPADGLAAALATAMRCVGLDRDATEARVGALLARVGAPDSYERRALAEIIAPTPPGQARQAGLVLRFSNPVERYAALARHLERVSRERPLILWVEDAQWGLDALGFVGYMMKRQQHAPCPLLFLVTARDEGLAEHRVAWLVLAELLTLPGAQRVDLAPLDAAEHRALVEALLGLQGDLVEQVEARTIGNPLFAVQLVGDWVQRGILKIGPAGFTLAEGAAVELPDDLHDVWTARLARFLEGRSPQARAALEIAAALGMEVHEPEWRAACLERGPALAAQVEPVGDALARARLARFEEGSLRFIHGMLRECLERQAAEAGQLPAHHWACVRALSALHPDPAPALRERLARHLEGAGQIEAACAALLDAARDRERWGEHRAVEALLDRRAALMAARALPPSDPRWGQGWISRARAMLQRGQLPEAMTQSLRAYEQAALYGWSDIARAATLQLGRIYLQNGAFDDAERFLAAARDLYDAAGEPREALDAARFLGNVALSRGDLDLAEHLFNEAIEGYRRLGDGWRVGLTLARLAGVHSRRGDLDLAESVHRQCLDQFEPAGVLIQTGHCHNSLGDLARKRGDLEAARASYARALADFEAIDSGSAHLVRLNLGLTLLAQRRTLEAADFIRPTIAVYEATGRRLLAVFACGAMLVCDAAAADFDAWDRHINAVAAFLADQHAAERDLAWSFQAAADLMATLDISRARVAWRLAADQWRAVGHPDHADALLARLTAAADPLP